MTFVRVWQMVTTWTPPLWRPVVRWRRAFVRYADISPSFDTQEMKRRAATAAGRRTP